MTELRCTVKADVYSLGIVMWELATEVRLWLHAAFACTAAAALCAHHSHLLLPSK